ncbi:MAG TPA: hypothetical protein PKN44_03040 [Bacteroidales bacterium]|nr:hypothetical protein [Bacteroidales bacterium]
MNLQNNKNTNQQVVAPTKEPSIQIDQRLKDEALTQVEQQGMVVVHCSCFTEIETRIRIWETTVLIDHSSGSRSKLLHAFGITVAPIWMFLEAGTTARFTLVFEICQRPANPSTFMRIFQKMEGFTLKESGGIKAMFTTSGSHEGKYRRMV